MNVLFVKMILCGMKRPNCICLTQTRLAPAAFLDISTRLRWGGKRRERTAHCRGRKKSFLTEDSGGKAAAQVGLAGTGGGRGGCPLSGDDKLSVSDTPNPQQQVPAQARDLPDTCGK